MTLWVIFDWDEASGRVHHVGYAPESDLNNTPVVNILSPFLGPVFLGRSVSATIDPPGLAIMPPVRWSIGIYNGCRGYARGSSGASCASCASADEDEDEDEAMGR